MTRVAIVGSEEKYWTPELREKAVRRIIEILKYHDIDEPPILVSGGCPKGGIDIWAEIVADTLGYRKKIFAPENWHWDTLCSAPLPCEDMVPVHMIKHCRSEVGCDFTARGYRDRNIKIVEYCDVLYCIDPAFRKWSGGRWTHREACRMGKEVHLELIE